MPSGQTQVLVTILEIVGEGQPEARTQVFVILFP